MSLYADYAREWLGRSVIETDVGFITYRYTDPTTVYIENLYVIPAFRQQSAASKMADSVIAEAKAKGCTKCLGSVVPSSANSTVSLKVLLAYGFELDSSSQDFILMKKVI